MKNIKEMNFEELYNWLVKNNEVSESQWYNIRSHKNVEDITFWGMIEGFSEYTITIIKDNGNIFISDLDISVIGE